MHIREFAFDQVKITEPVLVNALEKEQEYLRSLEPDRLLAGFRETAGLPKVADRYPGGWENSELSGHTLGHYMVALAQLYAATKAEDMKERLDYVLSELSACQTESGYLFASKEEIFDRLEEGGLAWMPWYTMHKLLTGLLAVYRLAECPEAMTIAKKLGNWICGRVLQWTEKVQRKVLCIADGGMNDCLYEMYKETGETAYLEAAEKFDDMKLFEKIAAGTDVLPNKHANNTIPKFLGALNRYMALGESEEFYLEAAEAFFDTVERNHTYITGGNGELEHFRSSGTLGANRTQCNCETCSSYNMLKLAERLYSVTGKKRYMEYYERTFMNAILGSQNPEDGMTAFFQPMEPGYFKTFSMPYTSFWCCTGTGMESFTKLNRGIYHRTEDALYVNRYIASELEAKEFGVSLTQTVDMEAFDEVSLVLKADAPKRFALCLRIPEWAGTGARVTVNGATVPCKEEDGYFVLDRTWADKDRIVLELFPEVKIHPLPDMENCVAATYGPFVLAAGLGREDMTAERMRTHVLVPTKKISVRERIVLEETLRLPEWFEHCNENFVKCEDKLAFSLRGADVEEGFLFEPYYKKYDERYGVYFEYHDMDNLPDDLRAFLEEQKRIEEERRAAEEERLRLEAEAEAERLRLEAEAEAERLRLEAEAEAERLRLEEEEAERRRLEEEERKRREAEEEAERQRLAEEERLRKEEEERIAAEVARLEEEERLRKEEEERLEAERRRLEEEERLRREAEEAERRRLEEEERLRREAEEEAERQRLAEEERLRREEEERLEAERRRLEEEERQRREAEEAERRRLEEEERKRREAEEEAERQRLEAVAAAEAARLAEEEEERQIVDEAKRIAAQKVADAERAAELAEAKAREEEANLKAAQLAAERVEADVVTKRAQAEQAEAEAAILKAQAEAEAAKADRAELLAKQAKANKEADKASKKAAKKRRKRYRDFRVGKLLAWIGGVLAVVILLYLFATPISKGFFVGKDAVDTFLANHFPKVATALNIKGSGDAMPVFKDAEGIYLVENAENFVAETVWPQGYQASVVRRNGKQYILVEGNGLKTYYLNEIAETDSKHVYLETETQKALYFWEYTFDAPEMLCPLSGAFNTSEVAQYAFYTGAEEKEIHLLDAVTLAEYKIMLQKDAVGQALNVTEYTEEDENTIIRLTVKDVPYSFAVPRKTGLLVPDDYKVGLSGFAYTVWEEGIHFEAYVESAGYYLGKAVGELEFKDQLYVVKEIEFCAYAEEEFGNAAEAPVIPATSGSGVQKERMEVQGDRGERLLVPVRSDVKRYEYDDTAFLAEKNGELSYVKAGKKVSVKGIDVSAQNGTIDWEKVAASGVEYAMIQIGSRGDEATGKCKTDANYSRNVKNALKAGVEVGVSFTSRATTVEEAKEEAQFVLKNIKDYEITWPVAVDTTEAIGAKATRASKLSAEERTACVKAFMEEIAAAGYTPVVYADARSAVLKLDAEELTAYDMWYAANGELSKYPYHYTMWQYNGEAEIPGVNGNTAMNLSFVDYGEGNNQEQ